MQVGRDYKKVYTFHNIDVRLRMCDYSRLDAGKEKIILGYKFYNVETRVNGNPEIWNAIRSAVV